MRCLQVQYVLGNYSYFTDINLLHEYKADWLLENYVRAVMLERFDVTEYQMEARILPL